jgi:hypothetical protein
MSLFRLVLFAALPLFIVVRGLSRYAPTPLITANLHAYLTVNNGPKTIFPYFQLRIISFAERNLDRWREACYIHP